MTLWRDATEAPVFDSPHSRFVGPCRDTRTPAERPNGYPAARPAPTSPHRGEGTDLASCALGEDAKTTALRRWARPKAWVMEWRRRIRSRRELMMLDERQLSDLHLTHIDAVCEARKPFWKE